MAKIVKNPITQGKPSLLAIAKSAKSVRPKSWLDTLSPEDRAEVIETCRLISSGEISCSGADIVKAWREAGVPVSKHKFADLLAKVRNGEIE